MSDRKFGEHATSARVASGNWLPFLIEVIKIILMKDTKSFFFYLQNSFDSRMNLQQNSKVPEQLYYGNCSPYSANNREII